MRRDTGVLGLLKELQPGNIVTVPPVVAEIQYGLERIDHHSKKFQLLSSEKEKWLSVINVLEWVPEASVHFGRIKADLERKGRMIDDFDMAIAAIAMAHDCGVITHNVNHFKRIDHLIVNHWTA
jgi:tRNA(fMet)-specific endonuclease VapC